MKEAWDKRYDSDEYIYGLKPNQFLSININTLKPGKILLPGDGEGRNSIYAAKLGWEVTAFDYSNSGKEKALKLTESYNLEINYEISDVNNFQTKKSFDVISIVFLHLTKETRIPFHKNLYKFLNPGGKVILECFSKSQIKNNSGGPKNLDLLYSIEDIKTDFSEYQIELLEETQVNLDEGPLHQGIANVIRLIARKI
jgi:cyclopropane fatty-acyl-phospholipid synthase-like methyltransferase